MLKHFVQICQLMKLTDKDIVEMVFFPVINEACRVLDEGIAVKASDLDIASIFGMGFPPYRSVLRCLIEFASHYRSVLGDLLTATCLLIGATNQGRCHVMGRLHRCKVHPWQVTGVGKAVRQLLRALLLPCRKSSKRDSAGEDANFVSAGTLLPISFFIYMFQKY